MHETEGQNGATYLSFKDLYPVMHETKGFCCYQCFWLQQKGDAFHLVNIPCTQTDPVFEMVDVSSTDHYVAEIEQGTARMTPEISADLLKRPVGRPKTGKALPQPKNSRYRARQAEKTVTVTFNREHLATLKLLLANAPVFGPSSRPAR